MTVTLSVNLVRRDANSDVIIDLTAQRVVTLNTEWMQLLEAKGLEWVEYLRTFPPTP